MTSLGANQLDYSRSSSVDSGVDLEFDASDTTLSDTSFTDEENNSDSSEFVNQL